MLSLGFEASDLDTVDQTACFAPSEVDYNLIYDQDGFRYGLMSDCLSV